MGANQFMNIKWANEVMKFKWDNEVNNGPMKL